MHIRGIHTSHAAVPAASAATAGTDERHGEGLGSLGGMDRGDRPGGPGSVPRPADDAGGESGPRAVTGPTAVEESSHDGDSSAETGAGPRTTPLRVDAQRNLEHVLRAAREVFGELGYGAPMEDVARRARVGVGTVYRRFPSKDVLVRRIAEEETARLTEQARTALGQEEEPWQALCAFLRSSVASGAGRLLPPQVLRADGWSDTGPAEASPRVPQQREAQFGAEGSAGRGGQPDLRLVAGSEGGAGRQVEQSAAAPVVDRAADWGDFGQEGSGTAELLGMVGELVQRARDADELRTDVTVGDVLLVIATAAPSLPDATQQAAVSGRLLDILLEGLRSRPRI